MQDWSSVTSGYEIFVEYQQVLGNFLLGSTRYFLSFEEITISWSVDAVAFCVFLSITRELSVRNWLQFDDSLLVAQKRWHDLYACIFILYKISEILYIKLLYTLYEAKL